MRIITIFIFILFLNHLSAQDTLRVMHYNLLDYGNSGFCSNNTNNTDQKDAWLRAIISYAEPDIFTVNELSEISTYHTRILDEVLNQSGYALFEMAASPNYADSYIVNQLYYNSEKLVLHSQEVAQSEVRDIDVYSLYYLNEGLLEGDTIFIHCIVAHLKAGNSSSDANKREIMTANTLDYLEEHGRPGNYLFMGDFNVYDGDEDAFQLMLTNNHQVFRFHDPVDEVGDWNNNWDYQHVHTQSTRTSETGCGASGGMDDRFDFILMNENINDHSDKVNYLEDSYWAFGQDGNRLNGTIKDPPNTILPAYIIDALFGMSDHLPVVMDLVVDESLAVDEVLPTSTLDVVYNNPARDVLRLRISSPYIGAANLSLLSTSGGLVYQQQLSLNGNTSVSVPLSQLPPGIYILRLFYAKELFTGKLVIIN
jgi:endonuclease/exonuclease/phosphatase family metal-dependent hydrolase